MLSAIEGLEFEAVVGGCLMRIRTGQMNPLDVLPMLRQLDPNAKVRDDFPSKGQQDRKVVWAMAVVINVRVTETGKFIDLTCKGEGGAVKVSVGRKNSDEFLPRLIELCRLNDEQLEQIKGAFEKKSSGVAILDDDTNFAVGYWTTQDGSCYLEKLATTIPG